MGINSTKSWFAVKMGINSTKGWFVVDRSGKIVVATDYINVKKGHSVVFLILYRLFSI